MRRRGTFGGAGHTSRFVTFVSASPISVTAAAAATRRRRAATEIHAVLPRITGHVLLTASGTSLAICSAKERDRSLAGAAI